MSAKNQLQEYFQKRKLSTPIYTTVRGGGVAHEPEFISSLEVFGQTFTSRIFPSKKIAEQDVAYEVLSYISNLEAQQTPKVSSTNVNKIILIDLENCPHLIETLNARVIGFMSNCCSMYQQKEKYSSIELQIVHSSIKDAADILISFYVAKLLYGEKTSLPIYIVTKDHFASALVDICKDIHQIKHITRLEDIM